MQICIQFFQQPVQLVNKFCLNLIERLFDFSESIHHVVCEEIDDLNIPLNVLLRGIFPISAVTTEGKVFGCCSVSLSARAGNASALHTVFVLDPSCV